MSANRSMHVQSTSGSYEEDSGAGYLLEMIYRRPEWQRQALCLGSGVEDSDVWFPSRGYAGKPGDDQKDPMDTKTTVLSLKRICNGTATTPPCPVRDECLEFAVNPDNNIDSGVWGGTSQRERKRILRGRRPPGGPNSGPECVNGHDKRESWNYTRDRCMVCQNESTRKAKLWKTGPAA